MYTAVSIISVLPSWPSDRPLSTHMLHESLHSIKLEVELFQREKEICKKCLLVSLFIHFDEHTNAVTRFLSFMETLPVIVKTIE